MPEMLHLMYMNRDLSNLEESSNNNDILQPLLKVKSGSGCTVQTYWYRWYILLQFSLFAFIQTLVSNMWSPIVQSTEVSLNFTSHDFDLLANWGVIGVLCFIPLNMWLLVQYGMRLAVVSGMFFVFIGCGLKCFPWSIHQLKYIIHIGQICNGIGGSPVLGAPTYISNTWFPSSERVLATGAMTLMGNIGGTASFLLGPFLVQQPQNTSCGNSTKLIHEMQMEIKTYCYINFGIAAAVFFMMLTFFPSKPPTPPSISAASSRLSFFKGWKVLMRKRTYWVLVLIFLLVVGSFYAWMGVMPLLYTDSKHRISQKEVGILGAVAGALGAGIGIVYCRLADFIKRYMNTMMIVSVIIAFIAALYLVTMSIGWISTPPFLFTHAGLWSSTLLLGTLVYSIQPLTMELAADAAFPVSEGTSTYVLMWFAMVINVSFFSILNAVPDQIVAHYMLLGLIGAALPLLYFSIPKSNPRLHMDEAVATN